MSDRPEFPEMIRRFGNTPNTLPTTAGLYIVDQPTHHHIPDWWINSTVFRLTRNGYWDMDGHRITADELANVILGGGRRQLVQLVPETENDQ